uniref:Secreted protein n=1 Tax=Achlya hypogyna TaxID=1202772 RepID=A0A0A7CPL2_ACHHY|nr:secreted protein [Achlya hypogyna]
MLLSALIPLILAGLDGTTAVTFFEWPHYLGRFHTVKPGEVSTSELPWRGSIQSIELAPTEQLVTYDEPDFRGNKAVWLRSTPYPGNWVGRIASFQIRPLNITAFPSPTHDEASWRLMGTWEGYLMVRLSVTVGGFPECYSTNGVNCKLEAHVENLLPLLASAQLTNNTDSNPITAATRGNASSDTIVLRRAPDNQTVFPAPCGPLRMEHWGETGLTKSQEWSSGHWCFKANQLLHAPVNAVRSSLNCYQRASSSDYIAGFMVSSTDGLQICLPENYTDTIVGVSVCHNFNERATCEAVVARILTEDNTSRMGIEFVSASGSESQPGVIGTIIAVSSGLLASGGAAFYCARKANGRLLNVEATYCSSHDGDDSEEATSEFHRQNSESKDVF